MSGRRLGAVAGVLALLALTLAAFAGCGSDGDDADDDSSPQQFTVTDLGEPIEVEAGESFEVVLDSNPTTGYSWRVTIDPPADVVTAAGSTYEPDSDSENLTGGGGKDTFTFEATKAGEATITFDYMPPGEPSKPAETKTAKVSVG